MKSPDFNGELTGDNFGGEKIMRRKARVEVPPRPIIMNRVCAGASKDTCSIPPIRDFVTRYTRRAKVILDPFAGDCKIGTITNDMNRDKPSDYHLDALTFLMFMEQEKVRADVVIFDPPYSPRQIKDCYESVGLKMEQWDAGRMASWKKERTIIRRLLRPGGIVLSFGWSSLGMGKVHDFEFLEILLVCHGTCHYDTICVAERKLP